MRRTYTLWAVMALLTASLLSACSDERPDDLSGLYNNIDRYTYTAASVGDTEKLGKGIKALNVTFTDGSDTLSVAFGCDEWTLQAYSYVATASITGNKQYTATLNGQTVVDGDIDVGLYDGVYVVNGILTDAGGNRAVINYKGDLTFVVGEDDPEASGYTMTVAYSYLYILDWTTYTVLYDYTLMFYYINIYDESGNFAGYLQLANTAYLSAEDLAGTYTVASGTTTALTCEAGYSYPSSSSWGGTNYVEGGNTQYVTAGEITLSIDTDSEGETLFSFTGSSLTTIDYYGNSGTGAISLKYITLQED